jgi:hypothetical protein
VTAQEPFAQALRSAAAEASADDLERILGEAAHLAERLTAQNELDETEAFFAGVRDFLARRSRIADEAWWVRQLREALESYDKARVERIRTLDVDREFSV